MNKVQWNKTYDTSYKTDKPCQFFLVFYDYNTLSFFNFVLIMSARLKVADIQHIFHMWSIKQKCQSRNSIIVIILGKSNLNMLSNDCNLDNIKLRTYTQNTKLSKILSIENVSVNLRNMTLWVTQFFYSKPQQSLSITVFEWFAYSSKICVNLL